MSLVTTDGNKDNFNLLNSLLKSKLDFLDLKKEQLETEIENCTVQPGGGNETEKGVHFMRVNYRAVAYLDRLAADRLPYLMTFMQVFVGAIESYEQIKVEYELIKLDKVGRRYNVEIYIDLFDDIYITPSDPGPIEWHGQSYDIAPNNYDLAEQGTVEGDIRND